MKKYNESETGIRGDDRHQKEGTEPRPRRGEGGRKPLPGLGALGGSEVQKERTFGGSEERRALYTQIRWIGRFRLCDLYVMYKASRPRRAFQFLSMI